MGVPLSDLLADPAVEARLRAAVGQEPPAGDPPSDGDDESKAMPSFIKDKIAKRDDADDDDKDDPKRKPHTFVGDGGLCRKCMAPKSAKVHSAAAAAGPDDEKADVELEAKDGLGQMERKGDPVAGATQVLSADEETGRVRAVVSVTGVEDRVKDIIEPGAYTKSIAKQEPIGVWSHDDKTWVARADSYRELLPGDPEIKQLGLRLSDGSPWPSHAGAVIVDARFNLDTPHGAAAFSDVKFFQGKTSWSIGYRATKATRNPRTGVRHIKELDWFEFSPVMVGANQHAMTLSVKSLAGEHSVDPDDATGLVDVDTLSTDELTRLVELKEQFGLDELEAKGVRRVRTPGGAQRYGVPIGSIIVAGGREVELPDGRTVSREAAANILADQRAGRSSGSSRPAASTARPNASKKPSELTDQELSDELDRFNNTSAPRFIMLNEEEKARKRGERTGPKASGGKDDDRSPGSARPGMVPDGNGGMKPGMVAGDRSADGGSRPRPSVSNDPPNFTPSKAPAGTYRGVNGDAITVASDGSALLRDRDGKVTRLATDDASRTIKTQKFTLRPGEPEVRDRRLAASDATLSSRGSDGATAEDIAKARRAVRGPDDGKKTPFGVVGEDVTVDGVSGELRGFNDGTGKIAIKTPNDGLRIFVPKGKGKGDDDGKGTAADRAGVVEVDDEARERARELGISDEDAAEQLAELRAEDDEKPKASGSLVPAPGPGGTADLSGWKRGDRGLREKPLPGGGRLLWTSETTNGGKGQTQLGVIDADGRSQGQMSMVLMGADKGKWIASSTRSRLGTFDTAEQAVAAIRKADPNAKERADNAAGDAKLTPTEERAKLNAINKRRRAKGQPPLLRLPNEAKNLDLAETTDDEVCSWAEPVEEVKGSRASLNRSPRKNWVEQAGELPAYIREIASSIEKEQGLPLDRAIPIAIGRVKKWARGGGDVKPDTIAKAAAAVAQWEALKARSGKKFDSELLDEMEQKATAALDALELLQSLGYEVKSADTTPPPTDDEADERLADPTEVAELLQRGAELKAAAGLVDISDLLAQRADLPEPPPFS